MVQHPAGNGLRYAAAVDVNNDGRADIVSTDVTGNTVDVQLGNGDGTFQSLHSFATGANPRMVTITDLSGDGIPDLAVSESGSNTVGILLGNGDGTFQARQPHTVGPSPYYVTAGDFNGDGVLDLITGDTGGSTASVLLGNAHTTSVNIGIRPIGGISLATQQGALDAQGQIDGYLDTVNQVSGTIGTALSRFQIAAHVASSIADVSQAAEARITDADTAENSAVLLRSKILQQASAAVLAQANQQPALVLALLHE